MQNKTIAAVRAALAAMASPAVIVFAMAVAVSVAGARADQPPPCLYFFTMQGCGPCAQVEPEIRRLSDAGYPVRVVDARQNPEWASHFQVDRTPTMILAVGGQVVQRHSGLISAAELAAWFQRLPPPSTETRAPATAVAEEPARVPERVAGRGSPTMGVREPGSSIEAAALAATVRLKVADQDGFSYATGTVVHAHHGEAVVLTCGHLFRQSGGRGTITAEVGWLPGSSPQTVPGHLIDYDAGPRDVALVLIRPGFEVPAVPLARADARISPGESVFTIGCDHGEPPTIRPTRVLKLARYDGAVKIDIGGRPVEGRSGGGMFNAAGELVGVCNAAAVDYDEGIYSSPENIWFALGRTGLDRILQGGLIAGGQTSSTQDRQPGSATDPAVAAIPATTAPAGALAAAGDALVPVRPRASSAEHPAADRPAPPRLTPVATGAGQPPIRPALLTNSGQGLADSAAETELIVVVRDRRTGQAQTVVIENPDQGLLESISRAESAPAGPASTPAELDRFASLRQSMPVPARTPGDYLQFRAQSPDPVR